MQTGTVTLSEGSWTTLFSLARPGVATVLIMGPIEGSVATELSASCDEDPFCSQGSASVSQSSANLAATFAVLRGISNVIDVQTSSFVSRSDSDDCLRFNGASCVSFNTGQVELRYDLSGRINSGNFQVRLDANASVVNLPEDIVLPDAAAFDGTYEYTVTVQQ